MSEQDETRALSAQKNEEINKLVERSRTYLLNMAWQQMPQDIKAREDADLIVDEIVQNALIKFWRAVTEKDILYPQAYLRKILYHEVINFTRKRQIALSLPLNGENELAQGKVLLAVSRDTDDPLHELVQRETIQELLEKIIEVAATLPRRQKWAFISSLKERIDDLAGLIDTLRRHNLDASEFPPPAEDEIPTHRSSLSIARKKLRERLNQILDGDQR